MLHWRDFEAPALGEIELGHLYERVLGRSAQLRARRARRRAVAGTAALTCLVVAGLVAASLATAEPGRRAVAGSSGRHAAWRLVSEVSAASSSWQALSSPGLEQPFSLVCPSDTTCYAVLAPRLEHGRLKPGGLEYTHDGGSTWQQAFGTGMSAPQISCANARDCDVLAGIAGRRTTFLTTTDGGHTWTSRPWPGVPGPSLSQAQAISCATISSCVVIASDGGFSSPSEVFTTSDGGISWSRRTFHTPASWFFAPSGLSCTGTSCVTVGSIQNRYKGASIAYTSDDGGVTWSPSSVPTSGDSPLGTSLTCPDITHCYTLTEGAVFRAKDGGRAWGQVSTSRLAGPPGPYRAWNFVSMSCASSSSCWLSGAALLNPPPGSTGQQQAGAPTPLPSPTGVGLGQTPGLLASTADGGSTWALSTPPAGVGAVMDITCPDTTTCFALGVERAGEVVLLTNAS